MSTEQEALERLKVDTDVLIEEAGYGELFGEDLKNVDEVVKETLLNKFLMANKYDVAKTKDHLIETLTWRKEFDPLSAAFEETHDKMYEKTGVIIENEDRVMIWELTGELPDEKETKRMFEDFDSYIRWYVGLVEMAASRLDFFDKAKSRLTRVTDDIGTLDMDSSIYHVLSTARRKRMEICKTHYPDMVDKIYLLNTPRIFGWAHTLFKPFLSKEARERGHVLPDGSKLADILGDWVPKRYGGKSESLHRLELTAGKESKESSSLLQEEKEEAVAGLRKRK